MFTLAKLCLAGVSVLCANEPQARAARNLLQGTVVTVPSQTMSTAMMVPASETSRQTQHRAAGSTGLDAAPADAPVEEPLSALEPGQVSSPSSPAECTDCNRSSDSDRVIGTAVGASMLSLALLCCCCMCLRMWASKKSTAQSNGRQSSGTARSRASRAIAFVGPVGTGLGGFDGGGGGGCDGGGGGC